ncbi:Cyanovirin-N [Exidia glandulosa HHB12029]|uniref:Cyanovirin-N n=1 Tax=Exidia glandulosa HHB12029 TaxID=1314781 RepID=A0A165PJ74_EXIGL|nr:Cyanovirin-N [Exidia glandulosa HHB12029]
MQFSGLFVLVAVALVPSVLAQNFGASCNNIHLTGTGPSVSVQATCFLPNGTTKSSTLGLSSCLTNSGGSLRCARGGNAMQSCSGCTLSGTSLRCNCGDGKGGNPSTTIDLNQCIANNNGNLGC